MSQAAYRPIIHKYAYVRSRKLLDSAEGQVCTAGFPGCTRDSKTTVAAHANYDFTGKGAGIKSSDIYSADMCQSCHDTYDGRKPSALNEDQKEWYFWRAFVRTLNRRIAEGLVVVK
jgi:hypothetical protein